MDRGPRWLRCCMSSCCSLILWVDCEELQRELSMSVGLCGFWVRGRNSGRGVWLVWANNVSLFCYYVFIVVE